MNISHLKYAVEVEKARSISQAAENLYMGQPNLSKAIRELENDLGITIFKRTSKGVIPTQKGEEFLGYAKSILMQIEEMESLYDSSEHERLRLSIAAPRASYVTQAFVRLCDSLREEKELEINFKETNTTEAIALVADRECSLGVIRYRSTYERYFVSLLTGKNLQYHVLWEFEPLLLLSEKHPLAQKEMIREEDLLPYIELTHGDFSVPFLSVAEARRVPQEQPHKKICIYERGSQFDLLNSLPETYMWVSPVPEDTLRRWQLVQRKLVSDRPRACRDVVIYAQGHRLTPPERLFISNLSDMRREFDAKAGEPR